MNAQHAGGIGATWGLSGRRPREWVHHVIALLDAAIGQLDHEPAVHGTILKAASLLRRQIDPEVAQAASDRKEGLRAWQARKVRAYIDSHIAGPVLVADLCALVQLSEGHFSRTFRRTFGKSPHAFVIKSRVELAAQYMLQTEAPLSDIALQCGFTDQPHLCRHFRQITGHTPAAWRRERSTQQERSFPNPIREEIAARRPDADGSADALGAACFATLQGTPRDPPRKPGIHAPCAQQRSPG
jgi:AraC family transcriptional regulator